jgi:hypothetical protein
MSAADQAKVREQLNRILDTHHFKNSKRYPVLLRFVVEEALEGRGEHLKERLLGVRVFDRPADYDTATDPIVRVTIAEIRKRIAQYYHDEEHDAEIRIELLPGRYAPEFRSRRDGGHPASQMAEAAEPVISAPLSVAQPTEDAAPNASSPQTKARRRWPGITLASALVVILATCGFFLWWNRPTALDEMWSPLLAAKGSVLFCLPTDVGKKRLPSGEPVPAAPTRGEDRPESFLDFESLGQNVVYSDMLAALQISNIMALHHRDYRVKLNVGTTLADLRLGPAVLIGGLDNPWTMRALATQRYHFTGTDEDRYWIADSERPEKKDWSLDLKLQWISVTRDYAIVSRVHNEQTGQPEIIVAGIGMSGTAAAGDFVTDKVRMEELSRRIGPGFKDRDFEVVLSTDVVNGIPGEPQIIAVSVR